MKEEGKETTLMILFAILVVFNIFAVATNIMSCVCSIDDTECIEACEQKGITNHITCFGANIISLIVVGLLIWVWSKK